MTIRQWVTHALLLPLKPVVAGLVSFVLSTSIFANPVLSNVASGQVTISQVPNSTVINQSSQKAIINWQSFNIGATESTHFQQPAGGIALNRINPAQGVSQIYGRLTATGQIILVNPAGIFFGPGSYVNVGGMIATTANISDQDFLNNYYRFSTVAGYNGAIVNQGQIIAADNGLIALIGGAVRNDGMIEANVGQVVLASGDAFSMSFAGNDLIGFSLDQGVTQKAVDQNGQVMDDGVSNNGTISANGGKVMIAAKDAARVLDKVINLSGYIEAKSVYQKNGQIIISGDTHAGIVRVASKVNATGKAAGSKGGNIDITGYNILIDSTADLDVSGDVGGGNMHIGGNYLGKGPLPNANALVMAPGAIINANAVTSGDGGNVILWSDNYTSVNGFISVLGGSESGDGGFIETSSKNILTVGDLSVDTRAENGATGMWLLDPWNVTINATSTLNGAFNGGVFTPTATGATVLNSTINSNLASANVEITTGTTGAEAGNITISAPITWSSGNTLTFTAAGTLAINAAITTGTAASALILNATGAVTQTGVISGSGRLVKNGAGTFTASQANTYSGTTTLNTGNITLSGSGTLAAGGGAITLNSGILTLDNSGTNVANRLGGRAVTMAGGEMVVIGNAGANTSETVGALTLNAGYSTITLTPNAARNTLLTFASHTANTGSAVLFRGINLGANTVASATANNSNIVFTAAPTLTGGAGNSGTSTVSILAGAIGAGGATGNTSTGTDFVTYNPPTGSVNGLRPLLAGEYTTTLGTNANIRLTANTNHTPGSDITINSLLLSGGITYNHDASGNAVWTTLNSGNLLSINGANSIISSIGSSRIGGTTSRLFAISGLTFNVAARATSSVTISGAGGVIYNDRVSAHGFSATTYVNNTNVQMNASSLFDPNGQVRLANHAGAIINLNNTNQQFSTLNGGGALGGNISLGSGTLTFGQGTYNGVISGTGNLVLTSTSTLTNANTYTGSTTINSPAKVTLTHTNALGSGSGGITINSGATLSLNWGATNGSGQALANTSTITLNGLGEFGSYGAIVSSDGSSFTTILNNPITLGSASGIGFGSNYNFGGTITLNGTINTNGFPFTITQVGNTVNVNGAVSGAGSLNASFLTSSPGTVNLNAANTHTGGTNFTLVSGFARGIVNVTHAAGLGDATGGAVTVGNGVTLNLNLTTGGTTLLLPSTTSITLNGNGSGGFNSALQASSLATINTPIILGSNANIRALNGNTLNLSSTATINNAGFLLTIGTTSDSGTVVNANGVISGAGGLTYNNLLGDLFLNAVNTYSGATTISAGRLHIIADSGLGTAPVSATPNFLNFGINLGGLYTSGAFTLNANRGMNTAYSAAVIAVESGTLTYNGIITQASSNRGINVNGPGTLILGGLSTYTGMTQVNGGGTLSINTIGNVAGGASAIGNPASGWGNINLNSGNLVYTGGNASTDRVIAGSGSLTVNASGTLTLTGANTYTGGTNITGGTLAISSDSNLGGTSGGITFSNNRILETTGTFTLGASRSITLNTGGGTLKSASGTLTVGGTFSGSGALTFDGPGSFVVGGNITASAITANANISSFTFGGTSMTASAGSLTLNPSTTFTNSSNITLTATGATSDINFGGTTLTGTNTLSLVAGRKIVINNPISAIYGTLNLTAPYASQSVTTSATGTIDVYNFHLISGQWYQLGTLPAFNVRNSFTLANDVAMTAQTARFLRATGGNGSGGTPYILTDIYGIQGINSGSVSDLIWSSFTLANDIDATGTLTWNDGKGFHPIGYFYSGGAGFAYNGTFNGNNKTINGLYIKRSQFETGSEGEMGSALIAVNYAGRVMNLGLTNADITSLNNRAGGLIAFASWQNNWVGYTQIATSSYVTGNITSRGGFVGGVIGYLGWGYADNLHNSATVTGINSSYVGGVVGYHSYGATLNNSYNTGTVQAVNTGYAGGLVGHADSSTNINISYSSGRVIAPAGLAGGFLGHNSGTAVTSSYWDTQTSLQSTATNTGALAGVTGRTTAQMMQAANFAGFSIASTGFTGTTPPGNTWLMIPGQTRPMLRTEWNTNVSTGHQLQLMSTALGAAYSLVSNIDLTNTRSSPADVWGTGLFNGVQTGAGFAPIGNATNSFTGSLNGQGYVINNLYILSASAVNSGLFGVINNSAIQQLGVSNAAVTQATSAIGSGIIVGSMLGTSSLSRVYASGAITNIGNTGGLAGEMNGTSSITDAYNLASVATTSGGAAGGIVGNMLTGTPSVTRTYSTGAITSGGNTPGGVIGTLNTGTVTNSLYDTTTSGLIVGIGSTGSNTGTTPGCFTGTSCLGGSTTKLSILASYTTPGWSITSTPSTTSTAPANTWFIFDGSTNGNTSGNTRPMLMMERVMSVSNGHQLQMMGSTLGANYQLSSNIDLSSGMNNLAEVWGTNASLTTGSGFVGIGNNTYNYSGNFNGVNYAIANLYMYSNTSPSNFGLFSVTANGSVVQNINLNTPTLNVITTSSQQIGALIGLAKGLVQNVAVYGGSVTTSGSMLMLGGVIGQADSTSVLNKVINTSNVTATGTSQYVGGIVGEFNGISLSNAYNSGNISGGIYIGGIAGQIQVGTSNPTITNAYNTGTITATSSTAGGIVGNISIASAVITNTYNSGLIVDTSGLSGGVVGRNNGSTVSNSFWDVDTSGQTSAFWSNSGTATNIYAGCFNGTCTTSTGSVNAANLYSGTTFANLSSVTNYTTTLSGAGGTAWNITGTPSSTSAMPTTTWFIFNGGTRPMLMSEYKTNVTNAHQLQLMGSTLGGNYSLASNVDLSSALTNKADVWGTNYLITSGAGFVPLGSSATPFVGILNGQNYTINNLYINSPTNTMTGLFGATSSTFLLSYLGITNANITVNNTATNGSAAAGILVGSNGGIIANTYVTGSITAGTSNYYTGGFVGINLASGSITNSFSEAFVTSGASSNNVGGFAGGNAGNIATSYTTGNNIVGNSSVSVGGFVGTSSGTINYTYNMNGVTANNGNNVGGLVGSVTAGTVSNSFSVGPVVSAGSTNVGGLIGLLSAGLVTNSFWDTQMSGQSSSAGGTAKTTAEMMTSTTFSGAGWNMTTIWNIINTQSYPYMRVLYSNTPRVITGTSSAAPTTLVRLAVNGVINDTAVTGANGAFYFFENYNNLSTVDRSIADSTPILIYLSGGAVVSNTIALAPTGTGSLSGATSLSLVADTVTAGNAGTSGALNNALLETAKGSLSDVGILYAVDGSNHLTLNSSKHFASTSGTTYTINGNLLATSANITLSGPVVLNTASPSITTTTSGNISISNTVNGGGNALTINTAGSSSLVSGVISNLTSLTKTGSGTLILSANNTYAGTTTISSGTLQLGNAGTTGTMGSGNTTNNAALVFNRTDTGLAISAVISGTGTVTQAGSGTTTLSGANSYTGTTSITNGVLSINSIGNSGTNTAIGNSSAAINLGAGTFQYTGTGHSSTRAITLTASGGAIDASGSGALTLSGGITGAFNVTLTGSSTAANTQSGVIGIGAGTLTKSGAGSWTLGNAANTYTGATSITGGTLSVGTLANGGINSSLGATAAATAIALSGGGILSYTGGTASMNRQFSTSGAGGTIQATTAAPLTLSGAIANAGTTLTFDTNTGNIGSSGVISGAGGITKSGSGTLGLNNAANSYTGATSITGGTLQVNTIANGGTNSSLGATAAATAIAISGGGILSYFGVAASMDRQFSIGAGGGTIQEFGNTTLTISGAINNNGNLLTLNAGIFSIISSGVISGAGGLTASGPGFVTLSNSANTYTGATSITGGTLSVGTIANGGTNSSLGATAASTAIALSGGGVLSYTGSTGSMDRQFATSGTGGTIRATAAGTMTLSGAINNAGTTLTFDNNTGNITASGIISGAGAVAKSNAGTTILSNNNTYAGGTTINAGTLQIGAGGATGAITGAIVDNGALVFNTSNSFTLSNTISGTGSLTQSGSGTVTISGTNSYTGATTVTAGVLSFNSIGITGTNTALGNSSAAINLGATGTLQYTGSGHSSARAITLTGSGGTIDASGAGALTLSGGVTGNTFGLVLTGTGTGNLNGVIGTTTGSVVKNGSGQWNLNATNTYTGGTTVNAGILNANTNNQALGLSGAITINAGSLYLTNITGSLTNTSLITLNGSGSGGLGAIANASTINTTLQNAITLGSNATIGILNSGELTLTGGITNAGFNLTLAANNGAFSLSNTMSGTGGLTITASTALARVTLTGTNQYTGATLVSGGYLAANSAGSLGDGTNNTSSITLAGNSSGLLLYGFDYLAAPNVIMSGNSTYISNNSNFGIANFGGLITLQNHASIHGGDGTLNITNPGTITGSGFNLTLDASAGGYLSIYSIIGTGTGTVTVGPTAFGSVTLFGANTYSGLTSVTGSGTLSASNDSALGSTAAGTTVANGATLNINNAAIGNEAVTISGNGVFGFGALSGSGTSSLSGNITLAAASLIVVNNGTFALTGTINNAGTALTVSANPYNNPLGGDMSASGVISGAGALIKNGPGTLTLSGANTYTGKTTVSAGTLSFNTLTNVSGGASALGAPTTVANGTIDLGATGVLLYTGNGNSSNRVVNLTASGGTINASGSGTLTLSGGVTGNTRNLVLAGTGSGTQSGVIATTTGSLIKNDAGTWTLSGANSYTGTTTINAGTVSINTIGIAGTNTALGNSSSAINLGAGTLRYTGSGHSSARPITLIASGGSLDASGTGALTLTGGITGAFNVTLTGTGSATESGVIGIGAGTVTKSGTGTWTLSNAANTYTGQTSINAGTLSVSTLANGGVNSSLGATIAGTPILMGGNSTLSYTGGTVSTDRNITTTGLNSTTSTITATNGAATLTLTGSLAINTSGTSLVFGNGNITVPGIISGGSGSVAEVLQKSGTGTLTLSGANSYDGVTYIAGTVSINTIGNTGTNTSLGNTNSGIYMGGGTLVYTGSGSTSTRNISLFNNSTIDNSGTGALNLGLVSTQFTPFARTLTLTGSATGANAGSISASHLAGNGDGAGGAVVKNGTGTWILVAPGSQTSTVINAGTLRVTNSSALGTGTTTVNAGTLDVNLGGATLANTAAITLNGSGDGGVGALYASGTSGTDIITNLITLGSASTIGVNTGGGLSITNAGTITGSGFALTLAGGGTGSLASIVGTGAGTVIKNGTGTWTLSRANTYTGLTTINAGTLIASNALALGTVAGGVSVVSGGTLNINGVAIGAEAVTLNGAGVGSNGALTGTGTSSLTGAVTLASDATIGGTGTLTLSGVVGQSGGTRALTKVGTGTLVLSGTNTYGGVTTISAGTLQIGAGSTTGALGSGNVTNNGALVFNRSNVYFVGNNISGTGSLTQSGSSVLILGGANSYDGVTTVNSGFIQAASSTALGSFVGETVVALGATLGISAVVGNEALTLNGGTLLGISGGSYAGLITLGASSTISSEETGFVLSNTGSITGSGFTLNLTGTYPQINNTLAASIDTGSGGVVVSQGTWTLTGASTYTGETLINNNGTLIATNPLSLGSAAGGTTVASNGTLVLTGTTISSGESLTLNGFGAYIRSAALVSEGTSSFAGLITLGSASSISVDSGTLALTNTGTITGSGFGLTFTGAGNGSIASIIGTGAGTVTKSGTGSWTLSGANTYTGNTTVSVGTLVAANASALGTTASGTSVTAGATLNINNVAIAGAEAITINGAGVSSLGALTGTGTAAYAGLVTLGSTSTIGSNSGIFTLSNAGTMTGSGLGLTFTGSGNGSIASVIGIGAGALTKSGSGTWTLAAANTYSGGTSVTGGTLRITNVSALGTGSAAMSGGSTLQLGAAFGAAITNNLSFNGATLSENNANASNSLSGTVTLSGANVFSVANATNDVLTISGVMSGTGTLSKTGLGMLIYTNTNTYTGAHTISRGIVNLQNSAGLGASGATATVATGGSLLLSAASLTIANNLTFNAGSFMISNIANATNIISGNVAFNGTTTLNVPSIVSSHLRLQGAITGSANITKSGAGTLVLAGNGSTTYSGTATIAAGTVQLASNTAIGTGTITLNSGSGLMINGSGLSLTNNINLNTAGSIINAGGSNTLSGDIAMNTTTNTFMIADASHTLTLSGVVSGSAGRNMVKNGNGTLLLTNANTYLGSTTVNTGTLSIGNATAMSSSAVTINSGASLSVASALGANITNAINLNNATLASNGNNTFATGNIVMTGSNTLSPASGTLTLANVVSGAGSLTKAGAGTLQLNNTNTYSGATTLINGTLTGNNATNPFGTGALNLNGGTLSTLVALTPGNSSITVGSGVSFTLGGAANLTFNAATLNSGSTLTITNTAITNFNGNLSGTGAIVINSGVGSVRFSGSNGSYSGAMTLTGGTLAINNNNVSLLGTGTLALNGGSLTALVALTNPIVNTFTVGGNMAVTGSNNMTFSGSGALNTGTTLTHSSSGTTTFSGSVIGAGNLIVNSGTLSMTGDNRGFSAGTSYSGLTTINNGGNFNVGHAEALGYSSVLATGATSLATGGIVTLNNVIINTGNAVTLNNGVLATSGAVTFNGAVTLTGGTAYNRLVVGAGSLFTQNSDINGSVANTASLTTQAGNSASRWFMNGEVGNVNGLNSFTNTVITTFGGTDVYTYGDQNHYMPITLVNDARFFTTVGNVNVYTTVDGQHPFVIQAGGSITLADAIGGTTAVSSINLSGSSISLNGSMSSVGDQTYNGSLLISGNTTFITNNSGSNVTLNKGAIGSGHLIGNADNMNSVYYYATQANMPVITYTNAEQTQGVIGGNLFFTNFNVFNVLLPTPAIPASAAADGSSTSTSVYTVLPGSVLDPASMDLLNFPEINAVTIDCAKSPSAECQSLIKYNYTFLNTDVLALTFE